MQLSETEVDEIVRLGGMAPSGGNSQPWHVRVAADRLDVSLSAERIGTFLDVGYKGSVFSIGSFIENATLASTAMGLTHQVEVHEFRSVSDRVATIQYLQRGGAEKRDPLFEQITRRHTNRHLHHGPLLPQASIDALVQTIEHWSSLRLRCLSQAAEKKRIAAVLGKGNAMLLRHRTTFGQMMSELRWTREEADRMRDGVALSTLELPQPAVMLLRVLRRFPALRLCLPRAALETMPEPAVMGSSHVCVLAVRGGLSTEALVNAGRALQRIWLRASALQISLQPLATLPFLVLRAQQFGGVGLSAQQTRELSAMGAELQAAYALQPEEYPLFIFRLATPAAEATDRALRLPHRGLYQRA